MTESEITALLLAHANGRPLPDILAEAYGLGWFDSAHYIATGERPERD